MLQFIWKQRETQVAAVTRPLKNFLNCELLQNTDKTQHVNSLVVAKLGANN